MLYTHIFFNGDAFEKADSVKYMEIFSSTNLNFSEHVNYTLIKAEKASHLFWKYVNIFRSLKVSGIANAFIVLVTPILLSCTELWFPATANSAAYLELKQFSVETMEKSN